ncbi:response regulator transcription factor [Roseivirga sp.]|uniref:response regulator transcription factor n=1 Tax=Roseivirga sp. TaxID=1964215 RepID=UPI002B26EEEC|nr:response regulator transcription factor [Roseivirga sp.]
MKTIRIFLVDDHKMIRDGLKFYLDEDERFEIIGEANNGQEALSMINKNSNFDVLVTDIVMPSMDGIELVKNLTQGGAIQFKILALTMLSETQHIKKILNYGIQGYILKSSGEEEIKRAITEVAAGNTYYSQEVTTIIMNNLRGNKSGGSRLAMEIPLTKREREVLHLIVKEYSNQEIADELFISVRTVDAHKRNLLEKTGAKNMAGLAIYALEKRLFDDL